MYCFDSELCALIFDSVKDIEVSFRTKMVNEYALLTGDSHWFLRKGLYINEQVYEDTLGIIRHEIDRSKKKEEFISHYYDTYHTPSFPPAWTTFEVVSFGTLSRLFSCLDSGIEPCKKIAAEFGLYDVKTLRNWIYAISILRNCCAHHSRIWNRRFHVKTELRHHTMYPFMDKDTVKTVKRNKLFAVLCCMKYFLNRVNPGNSFKEDLCRIFGTGGRLLRLKDMGFPEEWEGIGVWRKEQ
ncbi:Abortive infection bacteriophage resistance protein [Bacteroidales bacterium Barb6]|nr:Abortive infection bacteriophage resistance protein [Bacteroidales bacterium Barb6]